MIKAISASILFLMPILAYAEAPPDAPVTETNTIGIVIFAILFFGSCISFFVWMWWKSKGKDKDKE